MVTYSALEASVKLHQCRIIIVPRGLVVGSRTCSPWQDGTVHSVTESETPQHRHTSQLIAGSGLHWRHLSPVQQ